MKGRKGKEERRRGGALEKYPKNLGGDMKKDEINSEEERVCGFICGFADIEQYDRDSKCI
jgi:hypothetical protein